MLHGRVHGIWLSVGHIVWPILGSCKLTENVLWVGSRPLMSSAVGR
jgi:hypothetical protein